MRICIIIPAYNEEKRIAKTLEKYSYFFKNQMINKELFYEIFIVINNTTDKTEKIVKKIAKKNKIVKYVNIKEGGKGNAIIYGFKQILNDNFDLIGFVDADMATMPEEIQKMVVKIGNYDGIIASRYIKGAEVYPKQNLNRILVSRIGNLIIRSLFLFSYNDTQCGAKIFKRKALEKVIRKLGLTNWAFDIDLLYQMKKVGLRIKEVPTVWRDVEDSKINLKKATIQVL